MRVTTWSVNSSSVQDKAEANNDLSAFEIAHKELCDLWMFVTPGCEHVFSEMTRR